MKFAKNEIKEYDAKCLICNIGVRYWENATVNGVEETEDGLNIPCRINDTWVLEIELETGIIKNWEHGKMATVHYKVCDAGCYFLQDDCRNTIAQKDGYVPYMLCPKENGYGDYIIMNIDENGKIENWKADLSYFNED